MKKLLLKVLIILASLSFVGSKLNIAYSAIFTWNGGSDNWNSATAWTISGSPTLSTWPGEVAGMEDTVVINSTGTVTVNVGFNNTSVKDFTINSGTVVFNNVLAIINGNLNIASGAIFNLGAGTLTIQGNTQISGSLIDNNNTGINTFVGSVNITDTGTFSTSNNSEYNFSGGITGSQNATLNLDGSGAKIFTVNNQTIHLQNAVKENAGNLVRINNMQISSGITVTNLGYLQVGDITRQGLLGTATFINGANAVLYTYHDLVPFAGIGMIFNFTSNPNTVNYNRNGGNQTILATTYHHLVVSNYGNTADRTKFLGGATTVNGKLIVEGNCATLPFTRAILQLGANNLTVLDSTFINCYGQIIDNNTLGAASFQNVVIAGSEAEYNFNAGSNHTVNGTFRVKSGGIVRDNNGTGNNNQLQKVVIETGGDFNIENNTIIFNDTVTVYGQLRNTSATGSIIFGGLLRILNNGIYTNTANQAVTFRGGIHYDGNTFTSGTGLHTFNTNPQNISGKLFTISGAVTATAKLRILDSLQINGVVNINMADSIVNYGVAILLNESAPSLNSNNANGRWHQMPNSRLLFYGQTMFTTNGQLSANAVGNEVHYARSNGDQTIRQTTYYNLRATNSSTTNDRNKTLGGAVNVLNKLWIQGNCVNNRRAILQLSTFNLTVGDTTFVNCFGRITDNNATGVVSFQTVMIDGTNADYSFESGSNHTINQNMVLRNGAAVFDANGTGNNNSLIGNLHIETGTIFGIDNNNITFGGKTFVSGLLRDNATAGTAAFNDSLIVLNGGLFNYNQASNLIVNGVLLVENGGQVQDDNANGLNNQTQKVRINTGGDFNIENNAIIFNDTVTVYGQLRNTSATGSIIFGSLLRILNNGIYTNTANQDVTFRGGIHFDGTTFTSGTGLHTFNTNPQNISGKLFTISGAVTATAKLRILDSLQINGVVNINMADSIINQGTVMLNNSSAGALNSNNANAIWHQAPASKLFFGGASMFTTNGQLSATAAGNEVHYNGTVAQIIRPVSYANLFADGTGNNTTTANISIIETLNVTGGLATLDIGTFTFNRTTPGGSLNIENGNTLIVRGFDNFPKNFTTINLATNSTVIYNRNPGNAAQNIEGAVYGNLTFANNDINAIKNATGNITVSNTLTLNGTSGGRFSLNGHTLTFAPSAVIAGTINNNNFIDLTNNGNVRRLYNAAGNFTFPIGFNNVLRSARFTLNSAVFSGAAGSRFVQLSTTPLAAPNQVDTTFSLNRFYTLTSANISNVNGHFQFSYRAADQPIVVTPAIEAAWVPGFWNGSSWALGTPAQVDAIADTANYTFSGVGNVSGNYTLALPPSFIKQTFFSRANGNWEDPNSWSLTGHTGAAYIVAPINNSNVFVGNGNTITISAAPARTMDTLNVYNNGRLELGSFDNLTVNRFIKSAGAGTIATQALAGDTARLPKINLSAPFYTSPNNTVEYMGTANYFLPKKSTYNNLHISGTGIKTQTVNISMNGVFSLLGGTTYHMEEYSITGAGSSCLIAANATLRVGKPSSSIATIFPSGFASYGLNAASNVRYSANGNQTIRNITYGNLFLETSGDKTPQANFTINGNLNVGTGTTFNFGGTARTIILNGNLSGPGTLNMANADHIINLRGASNSIGSLITSATNSYVIYDGNLNQEIFPSNNYRFLRTGGSGIKTPSGTTFTAALGTEIFGPSTFRINTNNFKANTAQLTVTINSQALFQGQGIRINTNNLVVNGLLEFSPEFTTAGAADTLNIAGNFNVGNFPTAKFVVNNFAGAQRATGTMRVILSGNFANSDTVIISDNTQFTLNGNWINNKYVAWNMFESRYPLVSFVRTTGTQLVENGLSFNNFPDVNIVQGATAKVELLRDMRVQRHFTLSSGRFFCGQEVGNSQNLLVTGDWRSNGGQFFAKNATVFFEGNEPTLIGTTAGTPHISGTKFYNLSITKTGTGANRIVQNTSLASILVRVNNNMSVLSGTYRVRDRATVLNDSDLVVRGNIFIASGACMDITAGSTGSDLSAEAANIHVYLHGDLTDQNIDANTFGNNTNGLWIGTINANNSITNKPTIHICGTNTTQTVTGFAANSGSRGGLFTGLTLPNVDIDGTNTTLRMGSALRIRGYARVRNTNRLVAAGANYNYYGLLLNDGAIATTPPSNYFVGLQVDAGGTFEAEAGANIYLHPRTKILAQANSNLNMVGSITSPISFIRDGTASSERHSHEYNGNISARFVRYQVGDAGGNSHITTSICGGNRAASVHLGATAVLAAFPNNFSNSDFASVGPTLGLRIDVPLTVGVNDTLTGVNFGGNTDTWNCHRVQTALVPVVFKNSGGLRGGSNFGPTWECDSGGGAPLANRAAFGKVRWTSTSTIRWTGDINTNWFNAGNWVPNQVPTRLDIVEIPTGRFRYPSLTNNAVAGQLIVGLSPSSDPLIPPIVPIQTASIHINSHTLDIIGDSTNVLGDVEIGNIKNGGSNAFINLGSGRLRLQGNLIFRQAVTVNTNDTVLGLIPSTGTLEFYAGRNVIIGMAANNTDPQGLYKLYNLEVDKGSGALAYNCGARMLVEDLILKSGTFRHGTCVDQSPLFIKGNMDITNGSFHDNRGEIINFISRNKANRTIRTGGNVYQRIHFTGGVGARYSLLDSFSVNTTANAIILINNGDTLETNGNTIIARTINVNNSVSNNGMLRVDANGTLLINNGGSVTIGNGTFVEIVGSNLGFANVNCVQTDGNYAFTVNGTIRARNYIFERLNANGLNIANGVIDPTFPNNLSFGIFDYGAQRASNSVDGPARYITVNTNALTGINYTFNDVAFANTGNRVAYSAANAGTGTLTLANVAAGNLTGVGTNQYTFQNSSGALGGVLAHENERDNPAFGQSTGFIRWVKPAIRWTGAVNTNWNVAGNWTSGTVPTKLDNVVISHSHKSGAFNVQIIGAKAVCRSLLIINSNEGTANTLGNITLNVNLNDLEVKQDISLSSGAASTINLSANRSIIVGTSIYNSGVFNAADNSTVIYHGDGTRQLGVNNFFNLSVIDSSSNNIYLLSNNTTIRGTLTIGANSTLDVTSNQYSLTLRGNYNPNGIFRHRKGVVNFEGLSHQFISNNAEFNRVIVNKPNGNIIIPTHKMRINELLFLVQGNIRTSSVYPKDPIESAGMGEVEIGENGDIAQASSSSFVDGRLTLFYKSSTLPVSKNFHIGKQNAGGYTLVPLRVRLTTPVPTRIRGEVFTFYSGATLPFTLVGNYVNCPTATTGWGYNIDHFSGIRYWQFDKLDPTGIDSARITLPWNSDDLVLVPTNLTIVKGNGLCVEKLTNTMTEAIGSPSAGIISSSVNFTTFSPFSFATELSRLDNPLPLDLLKFEGKHEAAKKENHLNWSTVNEHNVSHFEIERSSDGINFGNIGALAASNENQQGANYQFVDKNPIANAYYRLKIVDQDRSFKYSNTINITTSKRDANEILALYPNPTNGKFNIKLAGEGMLTISDITGKQMFSKYISEVSLQEIDAQQWSNGLYLVEWITHFGKSTKKLIKQ